MRNFTPTLAFIITLTSSCLFAQDEKAAIARFEKQLTAVKTEAERSAAKAKENPMSGLIAVRKLASAVIEVETDGLPADLKAVYGEFAVVFGKINHALKEWPSELDALKLFLEKKAATDPAGLQKTVQEVDALFAQLKPIEERGDAIAKKYGIGAFSSSSPAVK